MTDLRQAAQMALEALEFIPESGSMLGAQAEAQRLASITSLRTALEQQAEPVSELQKRYLESEKAFQQQAEPVAWMDREGDLYKMPEIPEWAPPHTMLYTTPPQRKRFDILAITTAYEQGVGKGHQAHGRSVEIENPYAPGECQQAWALGYDEGKEQAASKAAHGIKD